MGLRYPILVVLLAVVCAGSVVQSPTSGAGNFELLILHNNDMHARFEQTSQLSGACTTADRDAGKCYGGFPRVAHVVKEARRAAASGEGPPVLYLNAGDTYTGTAWFTIYKWKIAAEFINALQPDAVVLGNDEIVNESYQTTAFLDNLETNVLASNVVLKSVHASIKKSIVIDFTNFKVGIVGYLSPENKENIENNEYVDEIIALSEEVNNLKNQNVNIIIALGHSNIEQDIRIAQEVDGIDLLIGGYKNSYYWNGTNSEANTNYNDVQLVKQNSGKEVRVIQSYAYNKYLGKLKIKFNADGDIIDLDNDSVLLDKTVPQDQNARNILKRLSNESIFKSVENIGQTAVTLDGESCGVEECNFGNLIADAVSYHYAVQFTGEYWTDAAITIIPGGAIKTSLALSDRPVTITMNDLLAAVPKESNVVAVSISGKDLLLVLEHAVANHVETNPSGEFLQFSGIRVVYDLEKAPGFRVISALVRCSSCHVPQFFVIEDSQIYKILMPASLASGDYGYSMLAGLPMDQLNFDEVTATSEYIRQHGLVYPEVNRRILILNRESDSGSATALVSTFMILITTSFVLLFN